MPSFDLVCRVDLQEVDNAIQQTLREIGQRFDFKGQRTEIRREEAAIHLLATDDFKLRALGDILREKMARRQVPLKSLSYGAVEPAAGGRARQTVTVQQGIAIEKARQIVKLVKESKLKVQAQIQGDQVRVSGKNRDDLQRVIQLLKQRELDVALQFVNFRE